jgi:hypothetical protein
MDGRAEISERTFQAKLLRIVRERFRANNNCDRVSEVPEASAHRAAHTASAENCVFELT